MLIPLSADADTPALAASVPEAVAVHGRHAMRSPHACVRVDAMHKDAESIAPALSRRQRLLWSLAAGWTVIVLGTTWLVDRQRNTQYITDTVSDAQMRVDTLHDSVESNFQQIAALA